MPATPIASVDRFFPTGTTKWYFVPSIVNPESPTRTELNAGTDLSPEIREVDGWTVSSDEIDTPDINSRFTSKIPGRITADASSLVMYADPTGNDARTLLPRNTEGFIVRLSGGDVATRKMDIFEVIVTSVSKDFGTDEEAGSLTIQFSIKSEPVEDVTIPA
jgi:hypothetical protein